MLQALNKNCEKKLETTKRKVVILEKMIEDATRKSYLSNKEFETFSYSVSHDLRAPIRAINGFSNILKKNYIEQFDEQGKNMLNTIANESVRMGQLIDDLIKFSGLGKKEMQKATVNMTALAKEIAEELLKLPEEKYKAKIKVNDLPEAECDNFLMRHVFQNLISNALKFSKSKTETLIEIGSYPEEKSTVYYVKDNGIGFDMKYAHKLFGIFERLHNTGVYQGTGIGLSIVKRIITRHGGIVWAEGKTNEGATFYFSLPK